MAKVYSADAASVFVQLMAEWKMEGLDAAHNCGQEFKREAELELSDGEVRKLAEMLSVVYSAEASIQISLIWREADMYLLRFALWEGLHYGSTPEDLERLESLSEENVA